MYRWSACPGSVREAAKAPPSASSSYAQEGTDAHTIAALCLQKNANPGAYIGKTVGVGVHAFTTTKEMATAVQVYIDAVDAVVDGESPTIKLQVEQRFDLSAVHPGCFGTADAVVWCPDTKTLHVFDYKHGAGIPVEVENNPQLMYYGLGALLASGYPARRVRLVIVQPRCEHPDGPVRSWEIDAIDLLDFRADLKEYAKATENPDAVLVAGEHCRFCPAAALCPELVARSQAVARLEFAPAVAYDPAKLSAALHDVDAIESRIKAVREFAYAEAEAGRFTGHGWKIVAKRAIRKWNDEAALAQHLERSYTGSVMREVYEPQSLKSPAQMEKVAGIGKGALDQFVIKESSGHALVPDSDKRPAVKAPAKDEFTALPAKTVFD